MAILSNGKFYGFLCSVKETGRKLANGVKEYVEDFVSGFAGHGWKIWEYVKGKWKLEIDTIVVRETMLVFEMLISKVRAIIGAQAITQGHGKVKSARISDDGTEYLIVLEDEDMSIVAHDFIRCQTFVGDKTKLYHVEVSSVDVETKTLHVPLSEFDKDESGNILCSPAAGDELVQFGNSQNKTRQSAIYIHADETGQPAIDVMFDVNSKNWDGKVKVRMGGDIPGGNGLKGFYSVNGMVKAVDDKGIVIYELSPDGSVNLGKGNIVYSPSTNKVTLGSGVTLTWNNLDNESKENLKGEPGENGISLVYKGELSSHPSNPKNGWYYRNITDKKSYVYQDGAWYVMTVDGLDGQDGNLLPWIEEWNGYATELGEEYIVTPKMFSGTKSVDGKLTGIVQGRECFTDKNGNKRTGIFALVNDEIVFSLDPINKNYRFSGSISTPPLHINNENIRQYGELSIGQAILFNLNIEKTGFNIQLDKTYSDSQGGVVIMKTLIISLPRKLMYEGTELNIISTDLHNSILIDGICSTVNNSEEYPVSRTSIWSEFLKPYKLKCIVFDSPSDSYNGLIEGKALEWVLLNT